jgi:hypothetical protein
MKDRIRLLQETNRVAASTNSERLRKLGSNKLLQLAQSRVSWLRDQLYSYWNPTYTTAVPKIAQSEATSTSPSIDSRPTTRQFNKSTLVMDERWWFWNVLFALTPAIGIALYCELRGKFVMREFHRGQELIELKKVLQYDDGDGDNVNDEEFEATAMAILKAREEAKAQEPEWYDTVLRFAHEVYAMGRLQWTSLVVGSTTDDSKVMENQSEGAGCDVNPATAATPLPSPTETSTSSAAMARVERTQQLQQPTPRRQIINPSNDIAEPAPSVQDLLHRIEGLEATIRSNGTKLPSPSPGSTSTSDDSEIDTNKQLQKSLQRVKQSGVRNRVEDELLQKWKPYMESAQLKVRPKSQVDEATVDVSTSSCIVANGVDDSTTADVVGNATVTNSSMSISGVSKNLWNLIRHLWADDTKSDRDDDSTEDTTLATAKHTSPTEGFPHGKASSAEQESLKSTGSKAAAAKSWRLWW